MFICRTRQKALTRIFNELWDSPVKCGECINRRGLYDIIVSFVRQNSSVQDQNNVTKMSKMLMSCFLLRKNILEREFFEYTFMSLELIKKEQILLDTFVKLCKSFTFFRLRIFFIEYELWRSEDLLYMHKSLSWYKGFIGSWKEVDKQRDFSQVQKFLDSQEKSEIGLVGNIYSIANDCFWSMVIEGWTQEKKTDDVVDIMKRLSHDFKILGPSNDEWITKVDSVLDIEYFTQLVQNDVWDLDVVVTWENNLRRLFEEVDAPAFVMVSHGDSAIERWVRAIEYSKNRCESLLRTKCIIQSVLPRDRMNVT